MGPHERSYGYSLPYVHTWPGKPLNRGTCKYSKARAARAKAKRA